MNGMHDLGGMHGFGPINPEHNEPVFHTEWERRAFALSMAVGECGDWNLDKSRHANECIEPARYLQISYYERWVHEMEVLLEQSGLLSRKEIDQRMHELRQTNP